MSTWTRHKHSTVELNFLKMKAKKICKKVPLLNPMVFYTRFPHIAKNILKKMNKKTLRNCRLLSKSWQEYIDNENLLWNKFLGNKDANKAFKFAIKQAHFKMTEFLILKSAQFNIDLNAKDIRGESAFQLAFNEKQSHIVDMLCEKSIEHKILIATGMWSS